MHRQLELWPTSMEANRPPKIWQTLTEQLEEDLIIALARLISKMVLAEVSDQTEEQRYER